MASLNIASPRVLVSEPSEDKYLFLGCPKGTLGGYLNRCKISNLHCESPSGRFLLTSVNLLLTVLP